MSRIRAHPLFNTVYRWTILLCATPVLLALITSFFSLPLTLGLLALDLLIFQSVFFVLYGSHRIKQEHNDLMHYRQIEARQQLSEWIKPRLPLPPMRGGAASPDLLLLLCRIMLQQQPQRIVECGAGVSTVILGYLAQQLGRGHVTTLEHNHEWFERVSRWIADHGLQDSVTLVHAPLVAQSETGTAFTWYAQPQVDALLAAAQPIDLLFVDGPPLYESSTDRYPALLRLGRAVAPDGVVVLDDTSRTGEQRLARDWQTKYGYSLEWIDNEKGAALLMGRQ